METAHSLRMEDGVTISYRLWRVGGAARPLLLLLHGMASNLTRWAEFVEHTTLRSDWDIMRVDLRGHGDSLYRGKLNAELWSQDLRQLLDAEGYPQALLIGHSLGAQIAVRFAHLHPQQTGGLVLIDPVLGKGSHGIILWGRRLRYFIWLLAFSTRLLNRIGLRRQEIPKRDLRILDEKMRHTVLAARKYEELVREYSSPWPDLKHFPTANYLQEIIEMVRALPALSSISAPVLVVLSKGVTYTDPEVSRQMIAQFPNAQTILIDAYHWPLTERPGEIRAAIEKWSASQRQRLAHSLN
jgi:esterase